VKIIKTVAAHWSRADLNAFGARFTLILAAINTVLLVVGHFEGKGTSDHALWVLGFTACSLGFRALSRLDELRAEHADRLEALAVVLDGQARRLDEMDSRLSTVVVRVRREV
jgi:hypothetical protein